MAVLLNLGSGTFGPAVNYIIGDGSGPNDVVVGDFDGDGRLDLATSNWVSETVTVLLNRSSAATSLAP